MAASNPLVYHRNYRASHREKMNAASVASSHRRKEKLAGRPRPGACEACGRKGKVVWDHDHKTGKFRAWICNGCNIFLGHVNDDPEVLRNLILILREQEVLS